MIWLSRHNPIPPVNLLQQYHPHQLMGKCHFRKTQCIVRALQHFPAQTDGTSDHKDDMAFALDPKTRACTQTKIIAVRDCYPKGPQKNARTADVTFTSGIIRLGGGKARLYAGLNDCETGTVLIEDPLDEYETLA